MILGGVTQHMLQAAHLPVSDALMTDALMH
jgi:hypothetical protein